MKITVSSVTHINSITIAVRVRITSTDSAEYANEGESLLDNKSRLTTRTNSFNENSSNKKINSEIKLFTCISELLSAIPQPQDIINLDFYNEMEYADKLTLAINKGYSILSYNANSAQMIKIKLMKRGFDRHIAEAAAEYLKSKGYIKEESDAVRMAERCYRKHWGLSRILAYLKSKGFDAATLYHVEESYSEVDFSENCAEFIMANYPKIPTQQKEKSKMMASLIYYGYSVSEIKKAINSIIQKSSDDKYDE